MHVGLVSLVDVEYGLDLATTLNEIGVPVSLFLSHARTARMLGAPDHLLQRLKELGLLSPACNVRILRLPRMRDPRSFLVYRRISWSMRDDGVDVAHLLLGPGELWVAVLACLLRDIPVASTMIIPEPNVGEDLPTSILFAINKLLAWGSDVVIVNGANQVAFLQKQYRLPASRVAHVPLNARTTAVRCSRSTNSEEQGTVLFFGRAHPHKGLEYLVRAEPIISRQIPSTRIVISAYGWDLERCRKMIQDSSRFEIHEGFVTTDVMAGFFQKASLVALPYVSASTSGVLLTAYGFRKPVVATSVGCLPEYVQDGVTGLLVPSRNVEQLANAIVRLLSDDVLRHRMGENASRMVADEQKKVSMRLLRTYNEAIAVHKNA